MIYTNWWNIRFLAILIFPSLFFQLEFFFLVQILVFIHAYLGLKTIFKDYINDFVIQIIYVLIFRILIFQIIRISLETWL